MAFPADPPVKHLEQINYFKEIEGAFVRRRGRNLLLSPVDWALMESWEKRGVPLRIILTTIDEVFDKAGADPGRAASIRSLSYCRDAVEARFRSWKDGRVGAEMPEGRVEAAAPDRLEGALSEDSDHLAAAVRRLESLAPALSSEASDAATKAVGILNNAIGSGDTSPEDVLDRVDRLIDDELFNAVDPEALNSALAKAGDEAGGKPAAMDESEYRRAAELLFRKKLRDESGIPRLSFFHL